MALMISAKKKRKSEARKENEGLRIGDYKINAP